MAHLAHQEVGCLPWFPTLLNRRLFRDKVRSMWIVQGNKVRQCSLSERKALLTAIRYNTLSTSLSVCNPAGTKIMVEVE